MKRFVRQTLVVARRDLVAIVFTPTFLLFLLAPLLMFGFGAIGGLGAARVASATPATSIVAVAAGEDARRLQAADERLRRIYRRSEAPPPLALAPPASDPRAQARALVSDPEGGVAAALADGLVVHGDGGERTAAYLAALSNAAALAELPGAEAVASPAIEKLATEAPASERERRGAAFFATFAIFFATLLLASQAVGMLAEERGNKVIEVLAAAVPLEAVFLGKLIGLFGVAIIFLTFWGVLGSQAAMLLPEILPGGASLAPAVGMPAFALLFLIYFVMAFLLLAAMFLGVGAQASTPREIQLLSLPITMLQVGMFALSSAAAGNAGSTVARVAELIPFSSPAAMAARAANDPAYWPHVAAIAWQLGWLVLVVWLSARLFRVGVLGSGLGRRRRSAPAASDEAAPATA